MTNLGTLEIGLRLNREGFNSELDRAKTALLSVRQLAIIPVSAALDDSSITRKLSSLQRKLDTLTITPKIDHAPLDKLNQHLDKKVDHLREVKKFYGTNVIKPTVDHSELTALNQHLGIKQTHLTQVRDHYRRNKIKPTVDTSELRELDKLLKSVKVSMGRGGDLTVRVFHDYHNSYENRLIGTLEHVTDRLTAEIRKSYSKGGVLGAVGRLAWGVIEFPFKTAARMLDNVVTGYFEKLGRTVADELGVSPVKGAIKKIKAGISNLDKFAIGKENQVFETFLSELLLSGNFKKAYDVSYQRTELGKSAAKLKELQDLALAKDDDTRKEMIKKSPEYRKIYAESLIEVSKEFPNANRAEKANMASLRFFEKAQEMPRKMIVEGIVNPFMAELTPLLKFIQGMRSYRTSLEAEAHYNERKATFPVLRKDEDIVSVIGGAQFKGGQGGRSVAMSVEMLAPNKRFIPVENPETDMMEGFRPEAEKNFLKALEKVVGPDLLQGDFLNTAVNAFRQIRNSLDFTGHSTAAAQALANAKLAMEQGRKASTLSFSLGGADNIQYAQTAKYMGFADEDISSLAMAYPFANITQNTPKGFNAAILKGDPLAFLKLLGVGFNTPQFITPNTGQGFGTENHHVKHLMKSMEFVELFFKTINAEIPDMSLKTLSNVVDAGDRLYEILGAARQLESLVNTGDFNFNDAFHGIKSGKTSELITKVTEATPVINKLGLSPQSQPIADALKKYIDSVMGGVVSKLKQYGVNLPDDLQKNFSGYMKYQTVAREINEALTEFKSGTLNETPSWFGGNLDAKTVRDRTTAPFDLKKQTIPWFKKQGSQFGDYQKDLIAAFEELDRITTEFIKGNGRLSDEIRESINLFPVDTFQDEGVNFLEKYFDSLELLKEEEARSLNNFVMPKSFQKRQTGILAYNQLFDVLGADKLPSVNDIKMSVTGASRADVLLTDKLAYKTHLNPYDRKNIANPQELKAYQQLQGRFTPLLYEGITGQALITERIQGRSLKEILDRIAKPYKLLQSAIADKQEQLEKLATQENVDVTKINELKTEIAALNINAQKEKIRFNKAANILYSQVGSLNRAIQDLNVVHNNLGAANVIFAQGGIASINLANAKVNPTNFDKFKDKSTTAQRAVIDKEYFGLMDVFNVTKSIEQGYLSPLQNRQSRIADTNLLSPINKGARVDLGSQTPTLLQQILGKINIPVKQPPSTTLLVQPEPITPPAEKTNLNNGLLNATTYYGNRMSTALDTLIDLFNQQLQQTKKDDATNPESAGEKNNRNDDDDGGLTVRRPNGPAPISPSDADRPELSRLENMLRRAAVGRLQTPTSNGTITALTGSESTSSLIVETIKRELAETLKFSLKGGGALALSSTTTAAQFLSKAYRVLESIEKPFLDITPFGGSIKGFGQSVGAPIIMGGAALTMLPPEMAATISHSVGKIVSLAMDYGGAEFASRVHGVISNSFANVPEGWGRQAIAGGVKGGLDLVSSEGIKEIVTGVKALGTTFAPSLVTGRVITGVLGNGLNMLTGSSGGITTSTGRVIEASTQKFIEAAQKLVTTEITPYEAGVKDFYTRDGLRTLARDQGLKIDDRMDKDQIFDALTKAFAPEKLGQLLLAASKKSRNDIGKNLLPPELPRIPVEQIVRQQSDKFRQTLRASNEFLSQGAVNPQIATAQAQGLLSELNKIQQGLAGIRSNPQNDIDKVRNIIVSLQKDIEKQTQLLQNKMRQMGIKSGQNYIEGINIGLNPKNVKSEQAGIIIVEGTDKGLGNKSPSWKGKESGKNFVKGISIGLDQQSQELFTKASNIGDKFVSSIKGLGERTKKAVIAGGLLSLAMALPSNAATTVQTNAFKGVIMNPANTQAQVVKGYDIDEKAFNDKGAIAYTSGPMFDKFVAQSGQRVNMIADVVQQGKVLQYSPNRQAAEERSYLGITKDGKLEFGYGGLKTNDPKRFNTFIGGLHTLYNDEVPQPPNYKGGYHSSLKQQMAYQAPRPRVFFAKTKDGQLATMMNQYDMTPAQLETYSRQMGFTAVMLPDHGNMSRLTIPGQSRSRILPQTLGGTGKSTPYQLRFSEKLTPIAPSIVPSSVKATEVNPVSLTPKIADTQTITRVTAQQINQVDRSLTVDLMGFLRTYGTSFATVASLLAALGGVSKNLGKIKTGASSLTEGAKRLTTSAITTTTELTTQLTTSIKGTSDQVKTKTSAAINKLNHEVKQVVDNTNNVITGLTTQLKTASLTGVNWIKAQGAKISTLPVITVPRRQESQVTESQPAPLLESVGGSGGGRKPPNPPLATPAPLEPDNNNNQPLSVTDNLIKWVNGQGGNKLSNSKVNFKKYAEILLKELEAGLDDQQVIAKIDQVIARMQREIETGDYSNEKALQDILVFKDDITSGGAKPLTTPSVEEASGGGNYGQPPKPPLSASAPLEPDNNDDFNFYRFWDAPPVNSGAVWNQAAPWDMPPLNVPNDPWYEPKQPKKFRKYAVPAQDESLGEFMNIDSEGLRGSVNSYSESTGNQPKARKFWKEPSPPNPRGNFTTTPVTEDNKDLEQYLSDPKIKPVYGRSFKSPAIRAAESTPILPSPQEQPQYKFDKDLRPNLMAQAKSAFDRLKQDRQGLKLADQAMQKAYTDYQNFIKRINIEKRDLEKSIATLVKQADAANNVVSDLQKALDTKIQLSPTVGRILELRRLKDEYQAKIKQRREALSKLFKAYQNGKEALTKNITSLSKSLTDTNQLIADLKELPQSTPVIQQINSLKQERDKYQANLQEQQQELDKLNQAFEARANKTEAYIKTLNEQLETANNVIADLSQQSGVQAKLSEVDARQAQIDKIKQSRDGYLDQANQQREQLVQKDVDGKEADAQLGQVITAQQDAQQRVTESENIAKAVASTAAAAQRRAFEDSKIPADVLVGRGNSLFRDAVKQQIKDLDTQLKLLVSSIKEKTDQIAVLQKKLERAKTAAQPNIDKATENVTQKQTALDTTTKTLSNLQSLNSNDASVQLSIERLSNLKERQEKELATAQTNLNRLNKALEKEIATITGSIQQAELELQNINTQRGQVHEQKRAAQESINVAVDKPLTEPTTEKKPQSSSKDLRQSILDDWNTKREKLIEGIDKVEEHFKEVGPSMAKGIVPAITAIVANIDGFIHSLSTAGTAVNSLNTVLDQLTDGQINLQKATLAVIGGFVLFKGAEFLLQPLFMAIQDLPFKMQEAVRVSVLAIADLQKVEINLRLAGVENASQAIDQLMAKSDEIGITFTETIRSYAQFKQVTVGTPLQAQADTIYTGFQSALAARQTNQQQQQESFRAINQIASKTKLSVEEFTQQLSETGGLTDALNVAARSMGMSTGEFYKQATAGNLLSQDVLPRLAAEYERMSASGLTIGADKLQAEINRVTNELEKLKLEFGEKLATPARLSLKGISGLLSILTANFETISLVARVSVQVAFIAIVKSILQFASAVRLGSLLGAGFATQIELIGIKTGTAATKMQVATLAMTSLVKAISTPLLIASAIQSVWAIWNAGAKEYKENLKVIEASTKRIDDFMKNRDNTKVRIVDRESTANILEKAGVPGAKNYAYGGKVSEQGLVADVSTAMKKERQMSGGKPVLAVLTEGEYVVPIKEVNHYLAWKQSKKIKNYAQGGNVSDYPYHPLDLNKMSFEDMKRHPLFKNFNEDINRFIFKSMIQPQQRRNKDIAEGDIGEKLRAIFDYKGYQSQGQLQWYSEGIDRTKRSKAIDGLKTNLKSFEGLLSEDNNISAFQSELQSIRDEIGLTRAKASNASANENPALVAKLREKEQELMKKEQDLIQNTLGTTGADIQANIDAAKANIAKLDEQLKNDEITLKDYIKDHREFTTVIDQLKRKQEEYLDVLIDQERLYRKLEYQTNRILNKRDNQQYQNETQATRRQIKLDEQFMSGKINEYELTVKVREEGIKAVEDKLSTLKGTANDLAGKINEGMSSAMDQQLSTFFEDDLKNLGVSSFSEAVSKDLLSVSAIDRVMQERQNDLDSNAKAKVLLNNTKELINVRQQYLQGEKELTQLTKEQLVERQRRLFAERQSKNNIINEKAQTELADATPTSRNRFYQRNQGLINLANLYNQLGVEQAKLNAAIKEDPLPIRENIARITKEIATTKLSLRDQSLDLEEYYIGVRRQIDDLKISIEDYQIQAFREVRGFNEAYADMNRTLERSLVEAQNALKQSERNLANSTLRLTLSSSRTPGVDSISKAMENLVLQYEEDIANIQNERDGFALRPMDMLNQSIEFARQVRGLQEQIYDAERARLKQLRDFFYQQMTLYRDIEIQQQTLQKINQEWTKIYEYTKVLVSKFSGLASGKESVRVTTKTVDNTQVKVGGIPQQYLQGTEAKPRVLQRGDMIDYGNGQIYKYDPVDTSKHPDLSKYGDISQPTVIQQQETSGSAEFDKLLMRSGLYKNWEGFAYPVLNPNLKQPTPQELADYQQVLNGVVPKQQPYQGVLNNVPQANIPLTPIPQYDFSRPIELQRQIQQVQRQTLGNDIANNQNRERQAFIESRDRTFADVRAREETTRGQFINLRDSKDTATDLINSSKGYLTFQETLAQTTRNATREIEKQRETLQGLIRGYKTDIENFDDEERRNILKERMFKATGSDEAFNRYAADVERKKQLLGQTEALEKQLEIYQTMRGLIAGVRKEEEQRLADSERYYGIMADAMDRGNTSMPLANIGRSHEGAQMRIRMDYERKRFDLNRYAETSGLSPERINEMRNALDEMEKTDLAKAFIDANPFAQAFGDAIKAIFSNTQNLGEALLNILTSLLQKLSEMASNQLLMMIFGGGGVNQSNPLNIFSKVNPFTTLGGGGDFFTGALEGFTGATMSLPLFNDGGKVESKDAVKILNCFEGGLIGQKEVKNFNDGGTVKPLGGLPPIKNYATGGAVDAYSLGVNAIKALKREREAGGGTPVLAALTAGEYVVPVKEVGQYLSWKSAIEVGNYSTGGIVGNATQNMIDNKVNNSTNNSSSNNMVVNNYNNVKVESRNDMGYSLNQINERNSIQTDRAKRRFG